MHDTDHLVLELKADWRFEGRGSAFQHDGRRLWLQLPAGARLTPAPGEAHDLRDVRHLRLSAGSVATLGELCSLARGWPCVQRVGIPA